MGKISNLFDEAQVPSDIEKFIKLTSNIAVLYKDAANLAKKIKSDNSNIKSVFWKGPIEYLLQDLNDADKIIKSVVKRSKSLSSDFKKGSKEN